MPIIDHADRVYVVYFIGSTIKARTIESILWDYCCAECEGKLESVANCDIDGVIVAHTIICPTCQKPAREIKHVSTIRQEMIDFRDVLDGLPPAMRSMVEQPQLSPADAEAAASALYK